MRNTLAILLNEFRGLPDGIIDHSGECYHPQDDHK